MCLSSKLTKKHDSNQISIIDHQNHPNFKIENHYNFNQHAKSLLL